MEDERQYGRALGRMIRDARTRAGLTQQDLGDEVNLSRTSITNIESGNQAVSVWLLHSIAEATGTTVVDLLPQAPDVRGPALPGDIPKPARDLIRRLENAR